LKKACSILLTVLVLMNTLGYYGIFFGLQYRNTVHMETRFDEGTYDASESIILKLPIAIPYVNSRGFERVDGIFEYQGDFYRLIKQKFQNDTLHVVCIKDERYKEIHKELVRYTTIFGDQHGGVIKAMDFIKDYLPNTTGIFHLSEGWQQLLNRKAVILNFCDSYHHDVFTPPKHA
jgi:hypothetical protein